MSQLQALLLEFYALCHRTYQKCYFQAQILVYEYHQDCLFTHHAHAPLPRVQPCLLKLLPVAHPLRHPPPPRPELPNHQKQDGWVIN